jgi:glycosyltransferase involved in cell wall biosynthesis
MTQPSLCFLVPGDWHTPTGGYAYDRRMTQALRAAGWSVTVCHLGGNWPQPDALALEQADACLKSLPDDTLVLADGLAFGAMPQLAQAHAGRIRWVALVHHPLHLETGIAEAERLRLLKCETHALKVAQQVVVTSRHTVNDVVAMGVPASHITVVEPGTDPVPLADRHRLPRPAGPVRLLCVATVTPRKGHAVLLQALAGLVGSDWQLHNVGSLDRDPDHASRVQALSEEGVTAGRVSWHGEVDAEALRAQYLQADVFVLPSLHEGFGMVVTEAVAHGLPVVASNAGALADTVPPQAGWLVPAGNAAALREALGRVIADEDLRARLAEGARAAALNLPDWPRQANLLARTLAALTPARP